MNSKPMLFCAPMVRGLLDDSKTMTRRVVKPQPEYHPVDWVGQMLVFKKRHGSGFWIWPNAKDKIAAECPHGQPGDQIWVKETYFAFGRWETRFNAKKGHDEWHFVDMTLETWHDYSYAADDANPGQLGNRRSAGVTPQWWKRPAIFMPRVASRITLEITGVRVERLHDISEADSKAEGCKADEPVTWWQGYKDHGEKLGLMHTQTMGDEAPEWMIEPHRMNAKPWLVRGAKDHYRTLWESLNGIGSWDLNQMVWVISFKRIQGAAA